MIPQKYAYLIGTLLFFIPWSILYFPRKDLRRAMIIMGIIAAIASLATAYFWTTDWWHPQTITGTRIGIEDFILGIGNGGIAAVLYETVFHKKFYKKDVNHDKETLFLIVSTFALGLFLFFSLHLYSFESCVIGLLVLSLVLIFLRKDLFLSSFINGVLMIIIVLPVYQVLMLISPEIIEKTYYTNTLNGAKITGVPIQELVFYFLFGLTIPLIYKYWHGMGLKSI